MELEKIRLPTPHTQTSMWNIFFPSWWSECQSAAFTGELSRPCQKQANKLNPPVRVLLCYKFTSWPGGVSNPAQPLTIHLVIHLTWRLIIKRSWYCIFMILFTTVKGETNPGWILWGPYQLTVELCVVCSALCKHFLWLRLHFTVPPCFFLLKWMVLHYSG